MECSFSTAHAAPVAPVKKGWGKVDETLHTCSYTLCFGTTPCACSRTILMLTHILCWKTALFHAGEGQEGSVGRAGDRRGGDGVLRLYTWNSFRACSLCVCVCVCLAVLVSLTDLAHASLPLSLSHALRTVMVSAVTASDLRTNHNRETPTTVPSTAAPAQHSRLRNRLAVAIVHLRGWSWRWRCVCQGEG